MPTGSLDAFPGRLLLTLLVMGVASCRTIIINPAPQLRPPEEQQRPPDDRPAPVTAVTLGIPPGHLPRQGECKIWIPGTPPGRQPYRRSRPCAGIVHVAPQGSWIVYRPTRDRRYVYVRHMDPRRAGVTVLVRMFEWESGRYVRDARPDEVPDDDRGNNDRPSDERQRPDRPPPRPRENPGVQRPPERPPEERPAVQRPVENPPEERRPVEKPEKPAEGPPPAERPPENKPPENKPPENKPPENKPDNKPRDERPQGERPEIRPRDNRPGASAPARLDIPPGHLPEPGQCRIWIPGTAPGQQRNETSGDCNAVARGAPVGSWVVYRSGNDRRVVHVRVIDDRRPGVIVAVWVFEDGRFVREERP